MNKKWLLTGFALALFLLCSVAQADVIVVGYDDRPRGGDDDGGSNAFSLLALTEIGTSTADRLWIADGNPSGTGEYRIGITFTNTVAAGTIINFNGDLDNPGLTDGFGNVLAAGFLAVEPDPQALVQPGPVYVYRSDSPMGLSEDDPLASFNILGGTPFSAPANVVEFRSVAAFSGAETLAYTGPQEVEGVGALFTDFIPLIQDENNWTVQTGDFVPPSGQFAIPEPSALGLLLIVAGLSVCRRKR